MTENNPIPGPVVERLKAAVAAFYATHGRVPSVIFDADEVIYPFWEVFIPFHNARYPDLPPVVGPFQDYNMGHGLPEEVGKAIYESLNALDWSTLHPDPKAYPVLAALINAGIDLSVATSHLVENLYQASAKVYQFHRDFNGHLDKRLVITQDKTRLLGDILVDDKPEVTGALIPQWEQLVFTQAYNLHVDAPRATWDDLIEVLTALIEARIPGYEYVAPVVEPEAEPVAVEPAADAAVEAEAEVPAVTLPWTDTEVEAEAVALPWETEAAAEEDDSEQVALPWAASEHAGAAVEMPWATEEEPAAEVAPVTMPWDDAPAAEPEAAAEGERTYFGDVAWDALTTGGDDK